MNKNKRLLYLSRVGLIAIRAALSNEESKGLEAELFFHEVSNRWMKLKREGK